MDVSGKIGIWGFGKEGQSLYDYIKPRGTYDELVILTDKVDKDIPNNLPCLFGEKAMEAISSGMFDLIFKSPGVSLYRDEVIKAKEKGTKFSSATNLWFEKNTKTKKIVITGTKGKSTTASLLYHVMKKNGLSVSLAGNVGIPLIDLQEETQYTVIELSSYQLADLNHPPDIFVITNLFPEHLQWHETHENYYADKLRPLSLKKDFPVLANAGNRQLKNRLNQSSKNLLWYNDKEYSPVKTTLKGGHNQENIQAVLGVCEILKLEENSVLSAIESFVPLSHRLQEFTTKNGIVCVNDSISTTPESAIAAIKIYQNHPLILILGGTDREQNYSDLIAYIKTIPIKAVLLLPGNGQRIKNQIDRQLPDSSVILFDELETLCAWAKDNANKEDIVLLSPSAPSYDQFKNFEERGNFFMKLMKS